MKLNRTRKGIIALVVIITIGVWIDCQHTGKSFAHVLSDMTRPYVIIGAVMLIMWFCVAKDKED